MTPRVLDLQDLGWAFGLIAIAIGLLRWQGVGLAGQIAIAAARACLQLLVMGFGLQLIWQLNSPLVTIGGIGAIALATTIAASNRIGDRMKNLAPIVGGAICTGLIVAVGYTILVVIKPTSWQQPQYLLACAGISLGYLLNSTAIAGERAIGEIERHQAEIETRLSLGATPAQAIAPYRQTAIKSTLVPTIDTLAISGLVTIPGFLAGGLLGGVQPVNAAGYQIVVLFMVMASNTIAATIVTSAIANRYFNQYAQLRSLD
ncbi:ABC transporter permease [Chamaesiphon polymorphus]|uniref:Iron export ABC transporter permease subunit FetB n=1 Tax=Chamaesiphon polymorphus CCALA 037 TaxID=2107692 RepID=A0A2T1GGV6_9CYAN|nr:iron export ABC transporter permease subunit FetB [Chamaesiphon polymorphus]PSB56751.1 iron export ABC transporter permease subunit FetB [Chamaesiphon polymorphus CCALA 037]